MPITIGPGYGGGAPGHQGGIGQKLRARWRRWWLISFKNKVGDIALPRQDVPVGVADIRVPADGVHPKIASLHRRISRAPMARPRWVVIRTAGPCIHRHRTGLGFGDACAHYPRDTAPQQYARCCPRQKSLHNPGLSASAPADVAFDLRGWPPARRRDSGQCRSPRHSLAVDA